jgi:predicted nucleic-acid-binding protein
VPHLALAEATWVLASVYDRDAAAIATAVEMLMNHQQLTLQDEDAVAAAVEQFRRRPTVEFSDCLMVAVSRKAGHGPLGTFDRDVGKLEGAERL